MRSDDDQVCALVFCFRQHFVANPAAPCHYFDLIITDAEVCAPLPHGRQSIFLLPRVKISRQQVRITRWEVIGNIKKS